MSRIPTGAVAVVLGGASGIGQASAAKLVADGWTVVAGDVVFDHAPGQLGEGLHTVWADGTDQASLDELCRYAGMLGPVRGAFFSAGLEVHGSVVDLDEADWHRVLDVNLTGAFRLGKAAVPLMVRAGGGSYVVMSSAQGLATEPGAGAYAATKAGVMALVRAMALDHAAQGVRANALACGSVDTPLLRHNAAALDPADPEGVLAQWGRIYALGRVARAEEIANVVAFLLSDQASFVTGATWLVDGGLLASFA